MNILAFDTCFDACSVAVDVADTNGARNISGRFEPMASGHAEALVPMIEQVMAEADMQTRDLDRIAFTTGPGSFTGTRISVATARAFAFALDVELVAFSSLRAIGGYATTRISDCSRDCDAVLVARDARRDQLYVEAVDSFGRSLTGPRLASSEQAAKLCPEHRLFVIGSGADSVLAAGRILGRELHDGRRPDAPQPEDLEPDARFLLGWAAAAEPLKQPPVPLYLRPPDAKPPAKSAFRRRDDPLTSSPETERNEMTMKTTPNTR